MDYYKRKDKAIKIIKAMLESKKFSEEAICLKVLEETGISQNFTKKFIKLSQSP